MEGGCGYKQSRAADNGWSSSLGVGRGANPAYFVTKYSQTKPWTWTDTLVRPRKRKRDMIILRWIFRKWDLEGVYWIELAQDRDRWWALVSAVMNLQVP